MIEIKQQPAEKIGDIEQDFDLIYMDPPFGLQREFTMVEKDGEKKGFADQWDSFDDYMVWYANIIIKSYYKLSYQGFFHY